MTWKYRAQGSEKEYSAGFSFVHYVCCGVNVRIIKFLTIHDISRRYGSIDGFLINKTMEDNNNNIPEIWYS